MALLTSFAGFYNLELRSNLIELRYEKLPSSLNEIDLNTNAVIHFIPSRLSFTPSLLSYTESTWKLKSIRDILLAVKKKHFKQETVEDTHLFVYMHQVAGYLSSLID